MTAPNKAQPGWDLGRRVAFRREELGLSQGELAERSGMNEGYVRYLEEWPAQLTRRALSRLAEALETTPEELQGSGFETPQGRGGPPGDAHPRLETLDQDTCMHLISPGGVGRVAFWVDGDAAPTVMPVNYTVLHGTIVFRTALAGTIMRYSRGYATFEVDRIDDAMREGWSVMAMGRSRWVRDPLELKMLESSATPQPWAGGDRNSYIKISPTRITGRRIVQHPETAR